MASNIREIITKAIISKGRKKTIHNYTFEHDGVEKILGCWIYNHHYDATIKDNVPVILGTFDAHLWYKEVGGTESKVLKKQITYMDKMEVVRKDDRDYLPEDEIEAICNKQPKCLKVDFVDGTITLEVEKDMTINIVGRTVLKVETKEEEETWDEVMDINPDFIT